MAATVDGVTVKIIRDVDLGGKYAVHVQVRSQRRLGLMADQLIDPGTVKNHKHLLYLVEAAGGAGAEYLGKRYGDNIDPVAAGRAAVRAFAEEARLLKELQASLDKKLKRLWAHRDFFDARRRESLERLRSRYKRGETITAGEAQWVDERLAEVHGNSI